MPDQLRAVTTLDVNLHLWCTVYFFFFFFLKTFTFGR